MDTSKNLAISRKNVLPIVGAADVVEQQGSLFATIDGRFEQDARRSERAELARIISEESKHPSPPAVVKQAWASLVHAIYELSFHQGNDDHTIAQSIRKTRNLNAAVTRVKPAPCFAHSPDLLDGWLIDLLITVGTLPIEGSDAAERFAVAGLERLDLKCDAKDEGGISAQGRNEALVCLEYLCAKAWYLRNRKFENATRTKASLFAALQFMYWECGIPTSLTLLWDEPPLLTSPIYDEVRKFNYRQLYAVQEQNKLNDLFTRIRSGVEALCERREYFESKFHTALKRDRRWTRDFSVNAEIIKAKYHTPEDC